MKRYYIVEHDEYIMLTDEQYIDFTSPDEFGITLNLLKA